MSVCVCMCVCMCSAQLHSSLRLVDTLFKKPHVYPHIIFRTRERRPWAQFSYSRCGTELNGTGDCPFLGAFAKLRKATVGFLISVRPSALNNSAPTGQIFMISNMYRPVCLCCPYSAAYHVDRSIRTRPPHSIHTTT
jgi:hypothetical protein